MSNTEKKTKKKRREDSLPHRYIVVDPPFGQIENHVYRFLDEFRPTRDVSHIRDINTIREATVLHQQMKEVRDGSFTNVQKLVLPGDLFETPSAKRNRVTGKKKKFVQNKLRTIAILSDI